MIWKHWPQQAENLNADLRADLLAHCRSLILGLEEPLRTRALEILTLNFETSPSRARSELYQYLVDRLDQIPILSETDQAKVEELIDFLLPEIF